MQPQTSLDHRSALIYVMVLCSAVDRNMSDREMLMIGDMVDKLPVFQGFPQEGLTAVTADCAQMLNGDGGLEVVLEKVAGALPARLGETAYAIACEIVACDNKASQEELRLLEIIRDRLRIDRLVAVAIERGIAALNRVG